MDIISLLEYLEEIIETSSKIPISGKSWSIRKRRLILLIR